MEAHIQDVRDGSIARNTEVSLKGVFITAVSRSIAGADYWVQEAQGVTTASHEYPQYAGMQVFIGPILAGTSFDVQRAKPGDCVDLIGPVGLEEGFPELGDVDKFTPRAAARRPSRSRSIRTKRSRASQRMQTRKPMALNRARTPLA